MSCKNSYLNLEVQYAGAGYKPKQLVSENYIDNIAAFNTKSIADEAYFGTARCAYQRASKAEYSAYLI